MHMEVRGASEGELDCLARIWYDSWHDAHARIVPPALTRLRTLDSFRSRLKAVLPDIRVAGPPGAPVGFCIARGDELYQLFVSAQWRGSGAAAALIADAEARLAERGVEVAWLACAIGNERAARLRKARMATGWNHGEPGGNVRRHVSAGSVAVREAAQAANLNAGGLPARAVEEFRIDTSPDRPCFIRNAAPQTPGPLRTSDTARTPAPGPRRRTA